MQFYINLNSSIILFMLIITTSGRALNNKENNNLPKDNYKNELYNAMVTIYRILKKHVQDDPSTSTSTNLPTWTKKSSDILLGIKKSKKPGRIKTNKTKYTRSSSIVTVPEKVGKRRFRNAWQEVRNHEISNKKKGKIIKKTLESKEKSENARSKNLKILKHERRNFKPMNTLVSDKYIVGKRDRFLSVLNTNPNFKNNFRENESPSFTFQRKFKIFAKFKGKGSAFEKLKLKHFATISKNNNIGTASHDFSETSLFLKPKNNSHHMIANLSQLPRNLLNDKHVKKLTLTAAETLNHSKGNSNLVIKYETTSDNRREVPTNISVYGFSVNSPSVKPYVKALNNSYDKNIPTDKPSRVNESLKLATKKEITTNGSQVGVQRDYNSTMFQDFNNFRMRNKNKLIISNPNFMNNAVNIDNKNMEKNTKPLSRDRKFNQTDFDAKSDIGLKQLASRRKGRIISSFHDKLNNSQIYYKTMNAMDVMFRYSSSHTLLLVTIISIISLMILTTVIVIRRFKNPQRKEKAEASSMSDNDYSSSFKKQLKKNKYKCGISSSKNKGVLKKYFGSFKCNAAENNNAFFSIGSDSDSTEDDDDTHKTCKTENVSSNTYWFTESFQRSTEKGNDPNSNYKHRRLISSENPCLKLSRLHRNFSKKNTNVSYTKAIKNGQTSPRDTHNVLIREKNLSANRTGSFPLTTASHSKVKGTDYINSSVVKNKYSPTSEIKDGDINSISSIASDTIQDETELDPSNPFSESFTPEKEKSK